MTLAEFNAAPARQAHAAMLACCASARFAAAMTAGRPYLSQAAAVRAVEAVFSTLSWEDVVQAMDGHPRIGARTAGQSAAEQSGVADGSRAALLAGNAAYEEQFGHVFLICATGRSAGSMLAALRERSGNDPATEREIVRGELRKINDLRIDRLLQDF